MATRLSLLWDFHILPSAVSQDLGTLTTKPPVVNAHVTQLYIIMIYCVREAPSIGSPCCYPRPT